MRRIIQILNKQSQKHHIWYQVTINFIMEIILKIFIQNQKITQGLTISGILDDNRLRFTLWAFKYFLIFS